MMTARPESIPAKIWAKIPPATQAAIWILATRGHIVSARLNRNGAVRYIVDNGARDMDAATLARRFKVD